MDARKSAKCLRFSPSSLGTRSKKIFYRPSHTFPFKQQATKMVRLDENKPLQNAFKHI